MERWFETFGCDSDRCVPAGCRLSRVQAVQRPFVKFIEKAVDAGNGADVAQAIRLRDQAIARAKEIHEIKQHAERQNAPQQPSIDELTMFHAREFMDDHKWYDASGDDEDSAVVLAIFNFALAILNPALASAKLASQVSGSNLNNSSPGFTY